MDPLDGQVDLHTHSNFSDGELTPTELVRRAKELGLWSISLTDHDNVDGLAEAVGAGFAEGVEVIPGVELSVEYRAMKDIHLLGYYVDWRSEVMRQRLRNFQEVRESRGEKILQRINVHLIRQGLRAIDYAEVRALARGSVGRPHIAQKLVEHGVAAGVNDAFDRYLVPFDVPKAYFTPAEAVEIIGAARGIVALAHPMVFTKDRGLLEQVVSEFKELGILALEAYYGDFTPSEISACRQIARQHGLVATGGSDYHGKGFPFQLGRLRDGRAIPYQVVRDLRRAYFQRYPVLIAVCGLRASLGEALVREAALDIGADSSSNALAASSGGRSSSCGKERSLVTLLAADDIKAERSLAECAQRAGLVPCVVRCDRDLPRAAVQPEGDWGQARPGTVPLRIFLDGRQMRSEPPEVAAQRLLHAVALFL